MMRKKLYEPPLQMTNLARKRTKKHRLLRRRCTRQGTFITFGFVLERLIWCFVFVRFGILRRFADKHWQKCVFQPSENRRSHPSVEWPFIVPLSRNIIPILCVSQYQWETCQAPSMYPPRSWRTPWSVSLHKGLQFSLLVFSPFKINKVGILLRYPNQGFPIQEFRFWPPPYRPGLCNLDHPVCHILLSILVFGPDGMHQTLHCVIQCIGAVHFHHCLILWIFRCTWKQPHRLITPVIEWMESRRCSDQKSESNSRMGRNSPSNTIFRLVPIRLIKNPTPPWTVWELAIAWWFRSRC